MLGTHAISAVYPGDTNVGGGSAAANPAQTVQKFVTSTSLSSNPASSATAGQPVTLTATVTAGGTPTGTVTFKDGSMVLGTAALNATPGNPDIATLTISTLTVGGVHLLTATYGGDRNFSGSMGSEPLTISQGTTGTTLISSANPSVSGLVAHAHGHGLGHQRHRHADRHSHLQRRRQRAGHGHARQQQQLTLNPYQAQATLTTSSLTSVGAHALTANYGGDTSFGGSTGAMTQTIQAPTTTILVSSQNPSNPSQQVTFTATVSANAPATGMPTGTVTFKDGGLSIGAGTINAGGKATFSTISFTTPGTHTITAVYTSDGNYLTSTSAPSHSGSEPDDHDDVGLCTQSVHSGPGGRLHGYSGSQHRHAHADRPGHLQGRRYGARRQSAERARNRPGLAVNHRLDHGGHPYDHGDLWRRHRTRPPAPAR